MPSIPRFHVTQTEEKVMIHINVPYVRVSDMEYYVDGVHFSFYCKPYLLKLKLPHGVLDNELAKAQYDPNLNHGTIVVHLPKETPGQHFEDLDLLTKLLLPRPKATSDALNVSKPVAKSAPLIEVMASTTTEAEEANDLGHTTSDSPQRDNTVGTSSGAQVDHSLLELEEQLQATNLNDPSVNMKVNLEDIKSGADSDKDQIKVRVTGLQPTYGFNNRHCDFFRCWHGEISEIIALPNPDTTPAEQRRIIREQAEENHFDVERYLLDFAHAQDDLYYQQAIEYEPFWQSQSQTQRSAAPKPSRISEISTSDAASLCDGVASLSISSDEDSSMVFSEADKELLLRLPHKEYLISSKSEEEHVLLGGLVDILIGFVYDHLVTQGDAGVESAWTLSTLSPTLSWLDSCGDLSSVVRSAMRRMVTYPFLRQCTLALRALRETHALLKSGRRMVLKALLEVYRILEKSETQYLLNALYVEDYCIWIQHLSDGTLTALANDLGQVLARFDKDQTGWALTEMEQMVLEAGGECGEAGAESYESSSEEEDESDSSEDESDDESDASEDSESGTNETNSTAPSSDVNPPPAPKK